MKKISVLLFIFITIVAVWAMLALFFSASIEDLKVQKDKAAMHVAWIFLLNSWDIPQKRAGQGQYCFDFVKVLSPEIVNEINTEGVVLMA